MLIAEPCRVCCCGFPARDPTRAYRKSNPNALIASKHVVAGGAYDRIVETHADRLISSALLTPLLEVKRPRPSAKKQNGLR